MTNIAVEITGASISSDDLPPSGSGVTMEQVQQAISEAISTLPPTLTTNDVQQAIDDTVAGLPSGVSMADVQQAIDAGLEALPPTLTMTDVQQAIDNTVAKLPPSISMTDVQQAIYDAVAGIPAGVKMTDVQQAISTSVVGLYAKPSGGIPKVDLAAAVQASLGKADTALQPTTPPPTPTVDPVTGKITAALKFGWGTPNRSDEFTVKPAYPNWTVYDGPGHAGNGVRTPNAVSVNNGVMSIIGDAQGNSAGMAWRPGQYRGRWEVCMKTSAGSVNYHPVILLWPDAQDWPIGGELDYVELLDSPTRQLVHFYLHYGAANDQAEQHVSVDATQWHAWALEWTATEINAFCDGVQYAHFTNTAMFPPRSMQLCLQLDNFGGNISQGGRMDFAWAKQYSLT